MSIEIKYMPLSFINTDKEILKQIKNTVLFSYLFQEFEETSLSHYLESTQYGYTASASEIGTHQLVRITDINSGKVDWNTVPFCDCAAETKYLLKDNDILVARTGGTTGKSFIVNSAPNNAIFASYLIRLRLKNEVNLEFINLYLNSYAFWSQIVEMKSGSAMPNVNAEKLKTLRIPKISFEEQSDFVTAFKNIEKSENLNSLFDKINEVESLFINSKKTVNELTHQLDLIKQLRQSFLREAMQGKLVKSYVTQETGQQLLAKIKAEKAQLIAEKKIKAGKLQEAEVLEGLHFEIPEHWVWCNLDDICFNITDGTHQTPIYTTSGRMFLSAQNVKPFRFIPEKHKYVSEEDYQIYIRNRKPEKGDLLIGRVGAGIGETAVIDQDLDFCIYVSVALVQPFKEYVNSDYLAQVFNSPYGVRYSKGNISSKGGSAGNFNLGRIRSFQIPLPPLHEQEQIVAKVEELMAFCDGLEQSIKQSQGYNEMLLQQVLREALHANEKV